MEILSQSYQPISPDQSQILIQDLVSISLDCIVYLRNVFVEDNFIDSTYIGNSNLTRSSVRTKRLIKGISKEADTFLEWVEKGLYDALRHNYLRAFQLLIYIEESSPHELVESYVFTLDSGDELTISINNSETKLSTNVSAREKVQHLIKRLIVLTQTFDTLPEEKFISLRLLYNDSCPNTFEPLFFEDATLKLKPRIVVSDGTVNIGSLDTGINSIDIKVLTSIGRAPNYLIKVDPFDILNKHKLHQEETCNFQIEFPTDSVFAYEQDYLGLNLFHTESRFNKVETQLKSSQRDDNSDVDENENFKIMSPNYSEQGSLNQSFGCESGCGVDQCHRCKTCNIMISPICYGNDGNDMLVNYSCYSCMFGTLDPLLTMLMHIRYLWVYFMESPEFPTMKNIYELLNLKINNLENDCQVKGLVNKLFEDNILMIVEKPCFRENSTDYVAGSGVFQPIIEGLMASEMGEETMPIELQKGKEYYILFVPRAQQEIMYLSYDRKMKPIYFPNYSVGRQASFIANFEKFKRSFKKSF